MIDTKKGVFRNTVCENCGADVRVCLNCRFYDPEAHYQCHESIPEAVRDKDRANFCDYFQARKDDGTSEGPNESGDGGAGKAESARRAFSSLFGDG